MFWLLGRVVSFQPMVSKTRMCAADRAGRAELALRQTRARASTSIFVQIGRLAIILMQSHALTMLAVEPVQQRTANQEGHVIISEGTVNYQEFEKPERIADTNQQLHLNDALRTLALAWAAIRLH